MEAVITDDCLDNRDRDFDSMEDEEANTLIMVLSKQEEVNLKQQ